MRLLGLRGWGMVGAVEGEGEGEGEGVRVVGARWEAEGHGAGVAGVDGRWRTGETRSKAKRRIEREWMEDRYRRHRRVALRRKKWMDGFEGAW